MKVSSLKLKNFSCFNDDWAGFDEFKPITVIIGRNNTGKSHLLDMVELLTQSDSVPKDYSSTCSGTLDENFLQSIFPSTRSSGTLGGNHWSDHGKHFLNQAVSWQHEASSNNYEVSDVNAFNHPNARVKQERVNLITHSFSGVGSPISKLGFRRILADRDVNPESASTELKLSSNGQGATNIIRRYITSSSLDEDLIQVELLGSLQDIFGSNGAFQRIEIRQHDDDSEQDGEELWEIFLGEPEKGLISLSRSGSGLKTIFLVLLNLLVIPQIEGKKRDQFVFAFEELENNLHPALLRRLFGFIAAYVEKEKCFVFLTTHSNVALDFFGQRSDSQIIHVSHDGKSASTRTIDAHFDHVGLLTELGARPSDLLQANGVIWLEGPSDRVYFNRFIELYADGELREGKDYQCAYYGGSNLANTTFSSPESTDETLTNLLRLNHNIALICDGDRTATTGEGSRIKGRVVRIKREVEAISGAYLWITEAKEIENYIPGEVWSAVYSTADVPDPDQYDRFPSTGLREDDFVMAKIDRKSFDKMEFSMKAVPHLSKENLAPRFDFDRNMTVLVEQIKKWNS